MQQKHEWSPYQKAVFEDVARGTGHTVVIARAGAAKTTTLIESCKYIPKKLKTLMVAFNKSIADELKDRVGSYIDTFTLHSLGFRAIRNSFGKSVTLNTEKSFKIIQSILADHKTDPKEKDDIAAIMSLRRAVSLCKGYLIDTPSKIDELIDSFDIDTCEFERKDFIQFVCLALRICKENNATIDFDDMVWYPYVYNLPIGQWDRVFIDEAQDLNAAQIHMALSAVKKNGRILAVGDPAQSLYSFRSADPEAIENIVKKLNAKTLPLSVSYRCAKKIVKLAQEIVPDIEHAIWAKDGYIRYTFEKNLINEARPGDFVLSRTNAPLIKHCMNFLKNGISANIQGRDVGAGLNSLIKKSKKKTVSAFLNWLYDWKDIEIERLAKKHRDVSPVIDKVECLESLCEGEKSLDSVKSSIKELFNNGDDSTRVIFSSIHQSKGLQRDRVFILNWTLRRGQNKEEDNIAYVGWTRAKEYLYLVSK